MVRYAEEQRRAWLAGLDKRVSSAGVIIEDEQGRVLAVKANYKDYWSLPGGVIDSGETPLTAAIREVSEEVGLALDAAQIRPLMTACRQGNDIVSYQFVFMTQVSGVAAEDLTLQTSELDDVRWFHKDEVAAEGHPMAWALRAWAGGVRGYCETRLRGAGGADEQIVTWRE